MQRRILVKLLGILLMICLVLMACSRETAGRRQESTPGGEDLPLPKTDQPPSVFFEMIRDVRTDEAGGEIIYAEYPRFTITGDGYEALSASIASINKELKEKSEEFLNNTEEYAKEYRAIDASYRFGQTAEGNVSRCDAEYICLMVLGSVEEGGPHPNNYTYTYNLNVKTGEKLKLSDVIPVDAALKNTIEKQLYENYPELEFDPVFVEQEIADILDRDAAVWYFWEGQLCIGFEEGSFGFSHAEGSLGVVIPLK